ncbi:nucleoside deaminase [Methylobacter sp. S3L5C]|uniref:nucleoside deaminase n=1 Tax=Methylobacter sp. S3L5C TaxID=2839024 RepID=UPI001FADE05F|nr:nucleoside deaminase [Methylobacter sp. S3L5C]UOA09543.1 nucleoside deaminase [Methylobacter sp. S3L5C]
MHDGFLQQAIDLAADNVSSGDGGPYGAIIVKDKRLIAASGNKVTSSLDPTAHAEISAIRMACIALNDFQLHDCILYTSCEPCPMCLGAIYWARLSKVYYACSRFDAAAANFDDSFIYDEILISPSERSIAMHHINLPNALQPFKLWTEKKVKVVY